MKGEGIGFGKAILFNEHFVVYGVPAIVSAVGKYTVAKVEPLSTHGMTLDDKRGATPRYKDDKLEQQKDSINRILKAMNIDTSKRGVKILLEGNLYAASGIGASAASCVAIARALSQCFSLNLSDDEINNVAFEGEKGYHGTPSGIDNTAATFGGLIWFKKGEPNVMDRISLPSPVEVVIGNTGKVADTSAVVAGVKERREKNPTKYKEIFERAENIAFLAKRALQDEDYEGVGKLMNENHKLLQQIEVSSNELDFIVDVARGNGALGAKLTGGGKGGNMIALTPGKDLQEQVATAIEKEGFEVLKTTIGVSRRGSRE
jgi:mevalonate kinase